ncbi:hypothetical protein [Sorangium sp. So ce131]|uniref:hypothetical protein n=1 Tax=Sorangium sp. So ce131 TaxID=3133282 RepID=UPI003F604267
MLATAFPAVPPTPDLTSDVDTQRWQSHARAALERVLYVHMPEELPEWLARYERVGERNPFLWRWTLRAMQITTLSSVAPELRSAAAMTKMLGIMFSVLLEDIAGVLQDREMLELCLEDPGSAAEESARERALDEGAREYIAFAREVAREMERRARALPRWDELEEVFQYDRDQIINTMRYAVLANRHPGLMNLVESELYQPHSTHMMLSCTIDLMASPGFDAEELGLVREAMWHAQRMGRLGDQISTWERKIKGSDFASEVVAHALRRGIIHVDQIRRGEREDVLAALRQHDVERYFLKEWQRLHGEVAVLAPHLATVDLHELLAGMEELIKLHVASKGLR